MKIKKPDFKALWKTYFSSINSSIRAAMGVGLVFMFVLNYFNNDKVEFFQRLELLAYDFRLVATMPKTIDTRIVIIDIDEKSLATEGRWPWGRNKLTALVTNAFEKYKVSVIGFDVMFPERDGSSGLQSLEALALGPLKDIPAFSKQLADLRPTLDFDARFTETIKKYPVVLGFAGQNSIGGDQGFLAIAKLPEPSISFKPGEIVPATKIIDGYSANLEEFQNAAAATGHILPELDFDGVIRRVPIFVNYKSNLYESLAFATLRTFLQNEPFSYRLRLDEDVGDGVEKFKWVKIGSTQIPLDTDGTVLVPYRGVNPMFRYISATDIINGKLEAGALEGKIALVGTSAQGLLDMRNVPVSSNYPGVEVHANMLSGFLDNQIKSKPDFYFVINILVILGLGIPLALALVKLGPLWSTITVILTAAGVVAANFALWQSGMVLPIAVPLLMIGGLYLLNMAYGFFIEARSKRQITGIFGTYVPKELVEEMAKNPDAYNVKGEARDMTVLFSDVRNFTTISEGLAATELTALMNDYLTEMTVSIQTRRGTIDKYIGDAIMAFWGAPLKDENHVENALYAALEMQKTVKAIGPRYIERGWPKLEIGVGLNCGVMNVGDMGSSFRRAYTVLGDSVNLAARLEGLTKEYGVEILVSEHIVKRVPTVVYRELDRVRVKGKLEPVGIFEAIAKKEELTEAELDAVDRFHRVIEKYRAQKWDDAEAIIQKLMETDPKRKAYKLYLERITKLRAEPPGENWDGVFTFTTK